MSGHPESTDFTAFRTGEIDGECYVHLGEFVDFLKSVDHGCYQYLGEVLQESLQLWTLQLSLYRGE